VAVLVDKEPFRQQKVNRLHDDVDWSLIDSAIFRSFSKILLSPSVEKTNIVLFIEPKIKRNAKADTAGSMRER